MSSAEVSKEFDGLLDLLKRARGFDFTGYKRASLVRRVRKRMQAVGANDYTNYMKVLERDPAEFDHLFNTVLINVTTFFRDGVPWDFLSQDIVPKILKRRGRETIRVWSAGCATGQEAYTLAIILAERLGNDEFLERVKIYATDLDDEALTYARQGSYTAKEMANVSEILRERYFERQNGRFYFKKPLRRCVIFGRNDLVDDAPISKIDLLVCRNTLMYFDSPTQARILNRFHFALREGGYLFLGKAETLSAHTNVFEPVDLQRRVFTKVAARSQPLGYEMARNGGGNGGNGSSFERELVSTAAFEKAPLAQFVVDSAGKLALANERARHLFHLNPADLGRQLQDLEVSYRPLELRSLIDQIRHEERAVSVGEVPWLIAGRERWFDVQLLPLYNSMREMVGVSVTYNDISDSRELKVELQRSHTELEAAYEELQSSNEELETTNEELQSTVEELETTNEELQSTNEELETMNEELQSTNEELGSINDELRNRGTQLNDLNRFLRSVFASLGGGVAVVDQQLRVKVWNHRAEDLWGVRSEEVVDQRFTDLDIGLPVEKVKPLITDTFKRDGHPAQLIVPAINRRGKKIQVRITATPLVEPDHKLAQGVILMMEEAGG